MLQKPLGTCKTEPEAFCFRGLKSKLSTKLLWISRLYPDTPSNDSSCLQSGGVKFASTRGGKLTFGGVGGGGIFALGE